MNLSVSPLATPPAADPAAAKQKKAAQDFEAVLLGQVMDALQKSFAGSAESGPIGSGDYGFMGAQALASAVAERGGIGIARMILKSWSAHKTGASQTPNAGALAAGETAIRAMGRKE